MLRNALEALGNLFSNKVVDVAMGIVTSIFVLPTIQSLDAIQTISTPFITTAFIVFLLSAIVFQLIGVALSWIAESTLAQITVKTIDKPEVIEKWSKDGTELTTSNIYCLQITNREHSELSDCHAVIAFDKPASHLYEHLLALGEKKLAWKNPRDLPCITSIGANGRSEILYVYKITASRRGDSKSLAMGYSDFCFCDQEKIVINMTPTKIVHAFSVVLHGKLNNKDVKSEKIYLSLEIEGVNARIYPTRKGIFNQRAS